jgi:hypothetical protein
MKKRRCFAADEQALHKMRKERISEFGAALIYKADGQIVATAFLHATWKRNVLLDWMATMPKQMDFAHKIDHLGEFMLRAVGVVAWQLLDANLIFIESKAGIAAKFYKKTLKLKKKCDFILLARDPSGKVPGWKICDQIYGLAKPKRRASLPL